MSDSLRADVAVIGGGIFGCLTAIELANKGFTVSLLEKNSDLLQGASLNNQNRLHLGYHYPRDVDTALQCQRGFADFKARFAESILDGFDNVYFISETGSRVTLQQYKKFCDDASLSFRSVGLEEFRPKLCNVLGGSYTAEVVYDSRILKELVLAELSQSLVSVRLDSQVQTVNEFDSGFLVSGGSFKLEARAVVNCSYANFNDFNHGLGVAPLRLQYELTTVPVVSWRPGERPVGITVMDGSFFTILPFGKTGNYLLYHVDHAVLGTKVGYEYPAEWREPRQVVTKSRAVESFQEMVSSAKPWLPALEEAVFIDYLTTVRVVLADADSTDRRPSLINKLELGSPFYTIFSGKIDHSIWVASEISRRLSVDLG